MIVAKGMCKLNFLQVMGSKWPCLKARDHIIGDRSPGMLTCLAEYHDRGRKRREKFDTEEDKEEQVIKNTSETGTQDRLK